MVTSSCVKPVATESVAPPEKTVKYLSKIIYYNDSGEEYIAESCTWDSSGKLLTFSTHLRDFPSENIFHYNSNGQISRIDIQHWIYGNGYYELFWKNKNEIDYIELYQNGHHFHYKYEYDNKGRCIQIDREDYGSFYMEWIDNNISNLCLIRNADTSYCFIYNSKYDDKPSMYSALPKFPLLHFAGTAYNPSVNNVLGYYDNGVIAGNFHYEYDEDGYPIEMFILVEGVKKNICSIEYEQNIITKTNNHES